MVVMPPEHQARQGLDIDDDNLLVFSIRRNTRASKNIMSDLFGYAVDENDTMFDALLRYLPNFGVPYDLKYGGADFHY